MLATFRFLKNLRDREHFLRTRYHRDHPHFWLFIALDAIVTVLIVSSLYNVAFGHGILDRQPHLLIDLGATSIDLKEVKNQARDHKVEFYWIGQEGISSYSTEVNDPERVILHYLDDSSETATRVLSVVAFPSLKSFNSATRGPLHPTQDIISTNARGDLISYNMSDLNQIAVTLQENSSVVVLKYPRPQSVQKLIADSERITALI